MHVHMNVCSGTVFASFKSQNTGLEEANKTQTNEHNAKLG